MVLSPQEQLYLRRDEKGEIEQKYTYTKKTDGYIHPDFKWYVNTGAFYKLYEDGVSSYAEIAEYDPIQLGFAVALVRGGKLVDVVEEKI